MNTLKSSSENIHFPVMLDEVIKICSPNKGGIFVDCTFGGGGYSKKLLEFPKTKVIALDRDQYVLYLSEKIKKKYSTRFNSIDKEYHFLEASKFINRWDELLKKTRFLFGDNHTIADWCIWPFVRQFKIACESQKKIKFFQPTMQKWLEYFENHKNFTDLMYKYSLWEPSSKTNYFPIN